MESSKMDDLWNTLDRTQLDQGVPYPPEMAGVPASTPCQANLRRSSRKSWFENTPGAKYEIACEKTSRRRSTRRDSEDAEILMLTHFTNPPRIGFGKMQPGQVRTRRLIIRNPHEYEQSVKVERVPTKRKFSVEETEFKVSEEEDYHLMITWSPVDEGNFREMFQFVVDDSYRLQTFVFGCVEAPPQKKKKRGLLGSKVRKPFSVIHTTSLANINRAYSPNKEEEKQSKKPQNTRRKSLRSGTSSNLESAGCNENITVKISEHEVTRNQPDINVASENDNQNNNCKVEMKNLQTDPSTRLRRKTPPKLIPYDKVVKKKMRRSNTYTNVSFLGADELPVIEGPVQEEKGVRDTVPIESESLNDEINRKSMTEPKRKMEVSVSPNVGLKTKQENHNKEAASYLVDDQDDAPEDLPQQMECANGDDTMALLDEGGHCISKDNIGLVSFIEPDLSKTPEQMKLNLHNQPSFLSPNSFLEDSLHYKRRHSLRLSLSDSLTSPTKVTKLKSEACTPKAVISPESFLKELNSTKEKVTLKARCAPSPDRIPSPESVLNDSIPHCIMVKQLENVKSELEKSFEMREKESKGYTGFVELSSGKAKKGKIGKIGKNFKQRSLPITRTNLEEVRRETFVTRKSDRMVENLNNNIPIRRETFVTKKSNENKKAVKRPFEEKPAEPSPRRTTFTVKSRQRKGQTVQQQTKPDHSENKQQKMSGRLRKPKETASEVTAGKTIGKDRKKGQVKMESSSPVSVEIKGSFLTVVKEKNSSCEKEGSLSGKNLFSGSTVGAESFSSPKEIVQSPVEQEEFARRTTLTVTKSRPSAALVENARRVSCALFKDETLSKSSEGKSLVVSNSRDIAAVAQTSSDRTVMKIVKTEDNSQSNVSDSFPSTPNQLPTSPNPDKSRRSTHVVENPKVVNLSKADRKQLFPPMEGSETRSGDGMMVEETVNPSKSSGLNGSLLKDKNNLSLEKLDSGSEFEEISEQTFSRKNSEEIDRVCIPKEADVSAGNRRRSSARLANKRLSNQNGYRSESAANQTSPDGKLSSENAKEIAYSAEKRRNSFANQAKARKVPFERKSMEKQTARKTSAENTKSEKIMDGQREKTELSQNADGLIFVPLHSEDGAKTTEELQREATLKKRPHSEAREAEDKRKRARSANVMDDGKKIGRSVPGRQKLSSTGNQQDSRRKTESVAGKRDVNPRAPVKGLPQSKLILVKKKKTVLPKHPLPFAAKNMYYDERWMEKQERGFVHWLNFVLTPAEEYQSSNVRVKVDAGKLSVDLAKRGSIKLAPTNEVLSFRAYTARRLLNRLRKSACRLYQSEPVIHVIQKLEAEVESLRLVVRKDKMLHADLGAKQKILDILLSYNPLWLRMGLETIFGEVIPLQSNSDVFGLSQFIITRVLGNPDIAQDYAHSTVPHLYKDGYAEALSQHTLKKFLLLVYFLDTAKLHRLIQHNPCLFCKDSEFKTSKDLLLCFSRDFLAGEGDITRHLGYLGYTVGYSQSALEEFDFAVSKLAVDLRDGLRLARILEQLCDLGELSKRLRVPAISRLQKIHNMELVFRTLTEKGVDPGAKVSPRDVVDGHRERTLQLLWNIILHFQVEVLLNETQLKEEVDILQRSLKVRNQLHMLLNYDLKPRRESAEPDLHTRNERLNLLLKWCRAVCAFYKIKIENFTVSFSDGRALCYILHHYHPGLLPRDMIHERTSMTHMEEMEVKGQKNAEISFNDSCCSPAVFPDTEDPAVYEELLNNEKGNFKTLFEKVKELGGIPLMLKWSDMSNTIPDEKVVVTYLLYLCARLLDIRHECRAARVIQLAWRHYSLKKAQTEYKVKSAAAQVIQTVVKKFLSARRLVRQQAAAIVIQKTWRGHKARTLLYSLKMAMRQESEFKAALVIKRALQGQVQRRHYQKLREATVCLQAHVRGFLQRREMLRRQNAAQLIQQQYRAVRQGRMDRLRYNRITSAVTQIQAHWRGCRTRKWHRQILAAVKIQAAWRCHQSQTVFKRLWRNTVFVQKQFRCMRDRKRYLATKSSATTIQLWFRSVMEMKKTRRQYLEQKTAVVVLQKFFRGYRCRSEYIHRRAAAIRIQASIRGFLVQKKYKILKNATGTIQIAWRAFLVARKERQWFLEKRQACVKIQHCWRSYIEKMKEQRSFAATRIQTAFRRYIRKMQYRRMKRAAVIVQSAYRGYLCRSKYQRLQRASGILQRRFRAHQLMKRATAKYARVKSAVLSIQAYWRRFVTQQDFVLKRKSAVVIQAKYRGYRCRREYKEQAQAAFTIQKYYRAAVLGKQVRRELKIQLGAAITVQAWWRGVVVCKFYQEYRQKVILAQSCVRGHLVRCRLARMVQAVTLVQRWYRSCVQMKEQRALYQSTRAAVVKMQTAVRGYLCRKNYKKKRNATIKLQAAAKKIFAHTRFVTLKKSVIVLQKHFRAVLERNRQRAHYQKMRQACVVLQAAARGMAARKLAHRDRAARTIQAYFRGHQTRVCYKRAKESIIWVQSKIRMSVARSEFLQKKAAAVVLQKIFRSRLLTKQTRQNFLSCKKAVVAIQAAYRGMKVRQMIRSIKAAITLQKVYKGYIARKMYSNTRQSVMLLQALVRKQLVRKYYLQLKNATVTVQRRFRARIVEERERRQFLVMKGAAVTIQAAYRGMKARQVVRSVRAAITLQKMYRGYRARKMFSEKRQSVLLLQAALRRCLARKHYLKLKNAAVCIQRRFRAKIAGRQERMHYLIMKGAAITIQARFKGYCVQKHVRSLHKSATIIQAWYRMHKRRELYVRMRTSVQKVQTWYRACTAAKKTRNEYLCMKEATIKLQSAYRGMVKRRTFRSVRSAVITTQAYIRGWLQRRTFSKMKWAIGICQSMYRAKVLGRQSKLEYEQLRKVTVGLQAIYRGVKERQNYKHIRSTIVTLQACVKGWLQRQRLQALKWAVTVCQHTYRAKMIGKQQRLDYQYKKQAAVRLQSIFRGLQERRKFCATRNAAIKIQSYYRGYRQRQSFSTLKRAAVSCQRRYRAKVVGRDQQRTYKQIIRAVVLVQSTYRGVVERRNYLRTRELTVRLQALIRGHLTRTAYIKKRKAVSVLQRRWRARVEGKEQRTRLSEMKRAAVRIQACYRGLQERRKYLRVRQGIVQFQALFRSFVKRSEYVLLKKAALNVQRRRRALLTGRQVKDSFVHKKFAAVVLQSAFRARQARLELKQRKAAVVLQSYFRMVQARRAYFQASVNIVLCQACIRAFIARRKFCRKRKAAWKIQERFRATLLGKQCRRDYLVKLGAIMTIQAVYRGYKERQHYQRCRTCIVCLQARVRGILQRQRYLKLVQAASKIQCRYRALKLAQMERKTFLEKKQSIVRLQSYVRMILAQKLMCKMKAARKIQSSFKMLKAKRDYAHKRHAAVTIQSYFRGMVARQSKEEKLGAVRCLQRNIRTFLLIQCLRRDVEKRRSAAMRIQSCFRTYLCRQEVKKQRASVKIQSVWRMCVERRRYLRVYSSVVRLQSRTRGVLARKKFHGVRQCHLAAVCIQKHYRGYAARQLAQKFKDERLSYLQRVCVVARVHCAAMTIQRAWRKYQTMKVARKRLDSVITIQRWMKCKLAGLLEIRRRRRAATAIQSVWRGHKVRKANKSKKVAAARKKVKAAAANVTEEKRMSNRTSSALDYLFQYKHLSHILDALMHLEVATRLVPVCCERLVEVNAVPVLYRLIRSCNRSLPHMEIIKLTISILLNLAKYEKTVWSVYSVDDCIDTLLELMQIYREKGAIFTRTCTLVAILALQDDCRQSILSQAKIISKLQSIHSLTARKNKIDETRMVTRAKMVAAKSFNSTLPVHTPHKQPKIRPDWILKRDKMREIDNPLQAINFVLESLNLTTR